MLKYLTLTFSLSLFISLSSASANNGSRNSSDSSVQNSTSTSGLDEILKRESFSEWKQWKEKYAECNPETNPKTSPIKIESGYIVKEPDMKGIFVRSKFPVDDCLTLSALLKEEDFEMEAVTLNALPGCREQLTHVSGEGDKPLSVRYFKRAIFFNTSTDREDARSLHQVLGKTFQMEIMMEFLAANKKDYTQISVMVETSEDTPANPVFTLLESALQNLTQEILDESSGKTERSKKFKEMKAECIKYEESHIQAHQKMKKNAYENRLQTVEKIQKNIKGITNKDIEQLKVNDASSGNSNESPANLKSSRGRREETEYSSESINVTDVNDQKMEKLQSEKLRLLEMIRNENDKWALHKLQDLYKMVERVVNKMEHAKYLEKGWSDYKLQVINEALRANQVGMPGESSFPGLLFDSPNEVYNNALEIKTKINEYNNLTALYHESCQNFTKFQMEPYVFVPLEQPFQISWLFPDNGGYYLYEGSNPIPKCEPRDITIVFEKPIKISAKQLSLFINLPSLSDQRKASNHQEIGNASEQGSTTIRIDDSQSETNRKVWLVDKNPIFVDDDGFHKKSTRIKHISGSCLISRESVVFYFIPIYDIIKHIFHH